MKILCSISIALNIVFMALLLLVWVRPADIPDLAKQSYSPKTFITSGRIGEETARITIDIDDRWSVTQTPENVQYGTAVLAMRLNAGNEPRQVIDLYVDHEHGDYFQFASTVALKHESGYWTRDTNGVSYEVRTSNDSFVITSSPIHCVNESLRLIISGDKLLSDSEIDTMLDSIIFDCN